MRLNRDFVHGLVLNLSSQLLFTLKVISARACLFNIGLSMLTLSFLTCLNHFIKYSSMAEDSVLPLLQSKSGTVVWFQQAAMRKL